MNLPRPSRRAQGDQAMITVELVIVLPILVAFLFLLVLAGRLTDARSDIVGAANDAARAASLQRNEADAQAQAQAAAEDTVAGERLNCTGTGPTVEIATVTSGTEDQAAGFGRGADVRVTVTCHVNTRDLTFIGVGTTVTLTEVAWEPIDPYRSL